MSAFDVKQISEQDAFKLQEAKRAEAEHLATSDEPGVAAIFDPQNSPVNEVVEQIMSHWADTDESWTKEVAEQTGDERMKKVVGEAALRDTKPTTGIEGDFQADTAGPTAGLEVPPRADGGEFGGGGGGGTGGGGDVGAPAWTGDEGGIADAVGGAEPPGFALETEPSTTYGGGGGGGGGKGGKGDDDDDGAEPPPEDPKKPKKP
jgi:hypothetical protein